MTKTIEAIWQLLQQHQGVTFHTAKGLPFTYTIRGGELFVNRRRKSITVSTVRRALEKITLLEAAGEVITGPKKIGCYGASYLYPVLLALDVLERPALPGQEEFTDAATVAFSTVCCAIMAAMVIWLHRSNIERLKNGTEYRFGGKKNSSK